MSVKQEQKTQKGAPKPSEKKADKKKEERGIHALYKIQGEEVTRLRQTCERCGPGYFMAKHQDRYTCGHCGFTRYRHVEL